MSASIALLATFGRWPVCGYDPPQTERKRPTPEELDSMRVDMVAEIEGNGVAVAEIEKMVDCFSSKWTPAHVEKIRTKLLPNLIAELMGA